MEKYTSNDILKATDQLIESIMESKVYKQHLEIREKLAKNKTIMNEIEEIKKLERAYVKSNFENREYKQQMDDKLFRLRQKPLYKVYEQSLEEINDMLSQLKEGLNDTFMDLLNSKKI